MAFVVRLIQIFFLFFNFVTTSQSNILKMCFVWTRLYRMKIILWNGDCVAYCLWLHTKKSTLVLLWLSDRVWRFGSVCAPCWHLQDLSLWLDSPTSPVLDSPRSSASAILSWSTPCYFDPVFLLNSFFPFPGLPVLIAFFWVSVEKPKSKNMNLWPPLEQWLLIICNGKCFIFKKRRFIFKY